MDTIEIVIKAPASVTEMLAAIWLARQPRNAGAPDPVPTQEDLMGLGLQLLIDMLFNEYRQAVSNLELQRINQESALRIKGMRDELDAWVKAQGDTIKVSGL